MGKIVVKNLRSYAYHGCLEAEKKIGAFYETTIWVSGDFTESEKSDDLKDAVDYEKLGIIVQEQMKLHIRLEKHKTLSLKNLLRLIRMKSFVLPHVRSVTIFITIPSISISVNKTFILCAINNETKW